MAEKTSNVYDILHPTPLSLQELSVIAVGLKLWRSEINEYRKSRTTESFIDSLYSNITPIISRLPKLPPVIYEMIVECVTRLGRSIRSWLLVYSSPVFYYFIKRDRSCVLEYFDDFVVDYDGTIDSVKTAERMMHCDSFDDCLKFTIACTYFLEDHVRRIWPSVRQKMDLRRIHFDRNPMMNYWIRLLRNQLNKIPIYPCDTVAEKMLLVCIYRPGNSLAINYFWNHVPYEDKMRIVIDVFRRNTECFVKSILPKLDDQQLEKFVNEKGESEYLMRALLEEHSHDERFIFQTLMYVKNAMNGSTFSNLVVIILRIEAGFFSRIVHDLDHQKIENWLHVGCIIWDSAPHHLKRSAITDISSDLELMICREDDKPPSITRTTSTSSEFLLSILSDFTLEESRSFWRNCWKNLMINKSARDLQRIMEICLKYEDDIIKFKENVIAESESLQRRCVWLLLCGNYDELDALVNFSYPHSAESAKHLKRRLLQSNFIGENSGFYSSYVVRCKKLDKFINTAYDSVDLANDFKHELVSYPNNLAAMLDCVRFAEFSYKALRKFIETFVSTEQFLQQIKSSIIDLLKEAAIRRRISTVHANNPFFDFDQFLLWCLGSNEQAMEFKQIIMTRLLPKISNRKRKR